MLAWTDLSQPLSRVSVCMYLAPNRVMAPNISQVNTLYDQGPDSWYSCCEQPGVANQLLLM